MKRNIELLTKVRDQAKHEPDKFDMSDWAKIPENVVKLKNGIAKISCGTTACIAGWAVQLAGDKFLVREDDRTLEGHYSTGDCVSRNGRVFDIEERAGKLLGLTISEANELFYMNDNGVALGLLDDLIAGKEIVSDDYFD